MYLLRCLYANVTSPITTTYSTIEEVERAVRTYSTGGTLTSYEVFKKVGEGKVTRSVSYVPEPDV